MIISVRTYDFLLSPSNSYRLQIIQQMSLVVKQVEILEQSSTMKDLLFIANAIILFEDANRVLEQEANIIPSHLR